LSFVQDREKQGESSSVEVCPKFVTKWGRGKKLETQIVPLNNRTLCEVYIKVWEF